MKFKNCMSRVADTPSLGQANKVVMMQAISEVEHVIRENCHIILEEVTAMLDISQVRQTVSSMMCYSSTDCMHGGWLEN